MTKFQVPEKEVVGFYLSPVSLFGVGSLEESVNMIAKKGLKNPLIVTDKFMLGPDQAADQVLKHLKDKGIKANIFDGVEPNPTIENVEEGLKVVQQVNADCIISVGGGSAHDCAKGIALVATNGGHISDYEGLDKAKKPQLPFVAINTTSGTASEITRFTIITDQKRKVKMAIIDENVTPNIAVNDPLTLIGMPKDLTAATGMDALTHAIEAYVSTNANPITDACALKAVDLIRENLHTAVHDGGNFEARKNMAYAEYLAGMAFNNASLGYVHAMAHQLGGFYHLAHGVCNAILLPHVQKFNSRVAGSRLATVAEHLHAENETAEGCVEAIKKLSVSLDIPPNLKHFPIVKREDFGILAEHAMKDACGITNPIQPTKEEIIQLFEDAYR